MPRKVNAAGASQPCGSYADYLKKVPPGIRDVFASYGPDDDLTANPLTIIGRQLLNESPVERRSHSEQTTTKKVSR